MRDYDAVQPIMDSIRNRHPGAVILLMPHADGTVELLQLAVPREERSQGIGSEIMDELVAWADENRKLLWLQVAERDPKSGTTSRNRLIRFYERFGFIRNKGRNLRYDLSLYVQMYREPMKRKSLGTPLDRDDIEEIFHTKEIRASQYEVEYLPFLDTPLDRGGRGYLHLYYNDLDRAYEDFSTIWDTGWVEQVSLYELHPRTLRERKDENPKYDFSS